MAALGRIGCHQLGIEGFFLRKLADAEDRKSQNIALVIDSLHDGVVVGFAQVAGGI